MHHSAFVYVKAVITPRNASECCLLSNVSPVFLHICSIPSTHHMGSNYPVIHQFCNLSFSTYVYICSPLWVNKGICDDGPPTSAHTSYRKRHISIIFLAFYSFIVYFSITTVRWVIITFPTVYIYTVNICTQFILLLRFLVSKPCGNRFYNEKCLLYSLLTVTRQRTRGKVKA